VVCVGAGQVALVFLDGVVRDLTFICAFFENQGMLREQQAVWTAYPPKLKQHFHVIVTDDLSPSAPAREAFEATGIASQRLYLALEHRRWDWLFCRNLGVAKATTDWVLLTDIDHVVPESTLRALLKTKLDVERVYRLSRVDAHHPFPWVPGSLTEYKPHPNTWLLTRTMFDRVGGYDERFSGYYGSDSEFRERVHSAAGDPLMLPDPLVRYPREVLADASTTTYERKAKEDGIHVPRIKKERAQLEDWRPLRLTIPYVLEASC
jgi:glycosyl transferase family 2